MTDALRFESVRVTTIRSTYWIGLLGLLLCGLVALGFGLDSPETGLSAAETTLLLAAGGESLPFSVMGLAVSLIGVLATGHEYRYGTILPTLTAMPRRSALLAAKLLIVAAVSAVAAVTAIAVTAATADTAATISSLAPSNADLRGIAVRVGRIVP